MTVQEPPPHRHHRASEIALCAGYALAVLLTLGLALYDSGRLPPGLLDAEASHGLLARAATGSGGALLTQAGERSPLLAAAIALVGRARGFDALTIRLAAALLASATTLLTGLWLGRLLGHRWGVVGALLLAGSSWLILFSRLGLSPVAGSLALAALLWTLTEALTRRGRPAETWYLAAGLAAGVGFLADPPLRLLPLLLPIGLVAAARSRPAGQAEERVRGLVLTLVVAALLISLDLGARPGGPGGLSFWGSAPGLGGNYRRGLGDALGGYGTALTRLVLPGAPLTALNLPDAALLGPLAVVWAALGLVWLLPRLRQPALLAALLWAALLLVPAALVAPLHPGRLLPLLPLLIALPLLGLRWLVERAAGTRLAGLTWLLVALTLLGNAGWSWRVVDRWASDPVTAAALSAGVTGSLTAIDGLPVDDPVLYSTVGHDEVLDYLAPDSQRRIDFDGREILPIFARENGYLVVPEETPVDPFLLETLGDLPLVQQSDHDHYRIYRIDQRARDRLPLGIPTSQYVDGARFLGHRLATGSGETLRLAFAWYLPGERQPRTLRVQLKPTEEGGETRSVEVRLPTKVVERPYYLLRLVTLQAPPAGTSADLEISLLDQFGQPVPGAGVDQQSGMLFLNRYRFEE